MCGAGPCGDWILSYVPYPQAMEVPALKAGKPRINSLPVRKELPGGGITFFEKSSLVQIMTKFLCIKDYTGKSETYKADERI